MTSDWLWTVVVALFAAWLVLLAITVCLEL